MSQPLIVQAEYSFKGGNNDELCFKKGDLITVTQREEGGWWEGTLNDKTGWFPSNYVNEYKAPLPLTETIRPPEEIQEYRSVVLKDLLDSERAHVAEVQGLLENFLEPLQQAQILTADEYAQLMCNFVEVVKTHEELLKQMEECNDRVGKLFLTKAPHMKLVHQAYCAAHPKAIVILDKHKDELEKYMERQGAASPGLLVLTTGLSKPFRRLDKYSAMLQELERHMESSHPDRGDTQRSVAVYKDIAAACSATRRQKELELQVLTGPVRGWQGQELSTLGDIIHMGSVAVGPDHRDRYFVLFPQTLLILSVSQRMSAFIYEGKLPLTGIIVNRLEDSDTVKNAFEINGPLIERIVAVCQGPNEANRWVELLTSANPTMPIGIKRQLSNLSNKSMSGSSSGHAPQPPPHMSPPANLGMLGAQRTNSQSSAAPATSMGGTSLSHPSQHKRSLSFNHHLSYNQYTHTQPPPPHHHLPPPQPNQQNHPVAPNHKSSLAPTSSNFSKSQYLAAVGGSTSAKIGNTRANWSITNLRPAPPLRPNLLNATTQSGSGVTSGSGSANALASYCSGRRTQPTFEEDVLVLRVFEGYCAAYQNTTRNTIHSALQPWTPCLPIRGGKLQTSKTFSTSNPQLPHLCNTGVPFPGNSGATNQQNSTNSLNSSYIWREASPNYFNLYSSSVSSLNATTTGVSGGANAGGYRYSLSGATTTNAGSGPSSLPIYERALSEERATRKSLNRMKSGFGSGYDNIFMTPLLPRKNKPSPKLVKNSYQTHQRSPPPSSTTLRNRSDSERLDLTPLTITEQEPPPQRQLQKQQRPPAPGLYDRRLNRSFETTVSHRYAGYGGGYIMSGYGPSTGYKMTPLRRSTPQLAGGEDVVDNGRDSDDVEDGPHGCSAALLRNGSSVGNCTAGDHEASTSADGDSQRHSGSWCCGLENEDMTPTLRQLWTAIRQMQQEMSQMKLQMNEERALRTSLQQLLMQHLEAGSAVSNTPKC
ncbi:rho guanine nucleotide exchange factor 7 isoform X2 [Bactrocera dorsalis]|uniref:Rho guanine nucleotide exchange factor 7 isoform X2 n=1 Tax=Bactrocera dorsalis TaxID=27457 RepID=A0ABM3J1Q7_BACDO|nr:rho guanine nucleotide exchange factor 7 isoform X2 [Bactrocera dorsalis]